MMWISLSVLFALYGAKLWVLGRQYGLVKGTVREKRLKRLIRQEICFLFMVVGLGLWLWPVGHPDGLYLLLYPLFFLLPWWRLVFWPYWKDRRQASGVPIGWIKDIPIFENDDRTQANARAYGGLRRPFVCCTKALSETLSGSHAKAVYAHEYGHISRGHHLKITLLVGFLYSIGVALILPETLGQLLVLVWAVRALVEVLVNVTMRRFEYEADQVAAEICGPQIFAESLKAIWAQNKQERRDDILFSWLLSAHPSPASRLRALGV